MAMLRLRRVGQWSTAALLVVLASGCGSSEQATPQATTQTTPEGTTQMNIVVPSLRSAPGAIPVTITYNATTSSCVVSYKKTPAYASPGQTIMWAVTNECAVGDKGIDVSNFAVSFVNNDSPAQGPRPIRLIPYDDTKLMVAVVKDKGQVVDGKTYPYHFVINGVQQADPDIIIEFETFLVVPGRR